MDNYTRLSIDNRMYKIIKIVFSILILYILFTNIDTIADIYNDINQPDLNINCNSPYFRSN